ncbi:MAG TPA: NFACT family protein, partial [Nitrospirota bacterium]|nr:NFACT family protein [Nitrospirota bacterium]
MDFSLLTQVIQELDANLNGGRIGRVSRNIQGDILLTVIKDRKSFTLLLSPDRELPRIHLLSTRPDRFPASSGFELYLKAHLAGAAIRSIGTLNEDRIAEIRCTRARKEYRLIFELFGPHSNILLCNGSSKILSVLRPVQPGVAVERPLSAGLE